MKVNKKEKDGNHGEMLMKKNESLNQQSDKEALEKQSNKMSSKSEV